MKRILKVMASIALAAGAVTSANALALFDGVNKFEDDNRELLVKGTACLTLPGGCIAGTIQVGDTLQGIIRFQAIEQVGGGSSVTPNPELTGIFATTVTSITPTGGGTGFITFGSNASFATTYGAGAMVAIFEGGTALPTNLDDCTPANCTVPASDGTHLFTFGLGDADDQWYSNGALNFGAVLGESSSTNVAILNYALSMLENNSGYMFAEQNLSCLTFTCGLGDNKTDLIGTGTVQGGLNLPQPGYGARSDIDAQLLVVSVPEPGTLALFGLALAGLGMTRRRKA